MLNLCVIISKSYLLFQILVLRQKKLHYLNTIDFKQLFFSTSKIHDILYPPKIIFGLKGEV